MPHVVLVAPRLFDTLHVVRAFAALGIELSLVSLDRRDALPAELQARVAGHRRVPSVLATEAIVESVRGIQAEVGRVDRLLGPFEVQQTPLALARDALGIEGIGADVARSFRDKDRMKEVLRAREVPVARSALVASMRAVHAFVEEVGLPIIVKPRAGVGASGTFRVSSPAELASLAARGAIPSPEAPLQLEELVVGRERTCETVTIRGTPVWRSSTHYLPSPLAVLEAPWQQYCVLLPREETDDELTRFAPVADAALAALFGHAARELAGTALTHMEWFATGDGIVNEVGARPPGAQIMTLLGVAHEVDFWRCWAELVVFERFAPPPRRWAAGVAFFRGQGPGSRVSAVDGLDAAVEAAGDALVKLEPPRRGQPRSPSYEGEGWAIVRAESTHGARDALRALIQRVRVRYAD